MSKVGVIAGNFDVIHPGYVKLFKECKENCDKFIVLLHSDPSIERPHKLPPILSLEERKEMLLCFEQIDEVLDYTYESDLFKLIDELKPDLRFLGDDYKNKTYTGIELGTKIHWISRDHGWSTTKFKTMISESLLNTVS